MQALRELAGETRSGTVAAYSGGETREIRQLRQAILSFANVGSAGLHNS